MYCQFDWPSKFKMNHVLAITDASIAVMRPRLMADGKAYSAFTIVSQSGNTARWLRAYPADTSFTQLSSENPCKNYLPAFVTD